MFAWKDKVSNKLSRLFADSSNSAPPSPTSSSSHNNSQVLFFWELIYCYFNGFLLFL